MPRHDPGTSFRALHKPGEPFSLINVWDKGSARLMAAKGAQALATSSGAHAFTLGRADLGRITRDEALAHAVDLVSATNLPVSGDFENGFGDSPDACAETVRLSAEAGLAGMKILPCRQTNPTRSSWPWNESEPLQALRGHSHVTSFLWLGLTVSCTEPTK